MKGLAISIGRLLTLQGTSGMFSSMMLIIVMITRVEQRASFMASFGYVVSPTATTAIDTDHRSVSSLSFHPLSVL